MPDNPAAEEITSQIDVTITAAWYIMWRTGHSYAASMEHEDKIPMDLNLSVTIMKRLESLSKLHRDAEGVELLVGGRDSYIYPEKFVAIAQKHGFPKYKTFTADDEAVISEVEGFLAKNRMVVIAAWKETIDIYLEPPVESKSTDASSSPHPAQIATEWAPYDQYIFQNMLETHIKYAGNRTFPSFNAVKYGIGCLRCGTVKPLGACANCGDQEYQLGRDGNRVGLFCLGCRRGFTSRKCSCGCENPIGYQTLYVTRDPKSTGRCFIVTAASCDVNSPEVVYLSNFRDDVLVKRRVGRLFIRCYYHVSPSLAQILTRIRPLQVVVLHWLVRPVIWILRAVR